MAATRTSRSPDERSGRRRRKKRRHDLRPLKFPGGWNSPTCADPKLIYLSTSASSDASIGGRGRGRGRGGGRSGSGGGCLGELALLT
jgi:hypothetical protein